MRSNKLHLSITGAALPQRKNQREDLQFSLYSCTRLVSLRRFFCNPVSCYNPVTANSSAENAHKSWVDIHVFRSGKGEDIAREGKWRAGLESPDPRAVNGYRRSWIAVLRLFLQGLREGRRQSFLRQSPFQSPLAPGLRQTSLTSVSFLRSPALVSSRARVLCRSKGAAQNKMSLAAFLALLLNFCSVFKSY